MWTLALALVLAAGRAGADEKKAAAAAPADATTVQLVDYFLKTPTADADAKLVTPFLAVDPESLPARQRAKARAKQVEIRTLIKLHDTKKKGSWLMPAEGCTMESFVHPMKDMGMYTIAGFGPITEDEEKYVMDKTHCTEVDLGCQFSLMIFAEKNKPRRLMLHEHDPMMALVAESHGKTGGQTNFFGAMGLTCQH